jgi:hypothetical protein
MVGLLYRRFFNKVTKTKTDPKKITVYKDNSVDVLTEQTYTESSEEDVLYKIDNPLYDINGIYIDADTSVSNGRDGSINNPYGSIIEAQSTIIPGDIVYCKGNFGDVSFSGSNTLGTDGNWITYTNWPLETPTIGNLNFAEEKVDYYLEFEGFDITENATMMCDSLGGSGSYITINGCHFIGVTATVQDSNPAIEVIGDYYPYSLINTHCLAFRNDDINNPAYGITIKNCLFEYGQNGLNINRYFYGTVIEDNEFRYFSDNAIEITGGGGNYLIQRNIIHDAVSNRGPWTFSYSYLKSDWESKRGQTITLETQAKTFSGIFMGYQADIGRPILVYLTEFSDADYFGEVGSWKLSNGDVLFTSTSSDNSHSDGISIESTGSGFDVYRNTIYNVTGQGVKVGSNGPNAQNIRIASNVIYSTGSYSLYFETGLVYAYNNTVDNPQGLRTVADTPNPTAYIFNNIIRTTGTSLAVALSYADYNVIRSDNWNPAGTNNETVSSDSNFNALFVNQASRNYTLVSGTSDGVDPNTILPEDMQTGFNLDRNGNMWTSWGRGAYKF